MSTGWSGFVAPPQLAQLPGLMIRCTCGHQKRLAREQLAALAAKGIATTSQLEPKLKCSVCEAKDGLDVVPLLRD